MFIMIMLMFFGGSLLHGSEHNIDMLRNLCEKEDYKTACEQYLKVQFKDTSEIVKIYQLVVDLTRKKECLENMQKTEIKNLLVTTMQKYRLTPQQTGVLFKCSFEQIRNLRLIENNWLPRVIHWRYPDECTKEVFDFICAEQLKLVQKQKNNPLVQLNILIDLLNRVDISSCLERKLGTY